MRVYISVDMEGVAGIATFDQLLRGGTGYPRAQRLMTAETNAAIAGAFDAGAESVTVNDSHGTMDNLIHDELDPRARVVFGAPKAQCMAHGLTPGYDVALFVGYHAAAGEVGVLSHTFSSFFSGFRLNGRTVSEAEVNALYAASVNVPVGLVTGDDVICAVAEKQFPDVVAVAVKKAEGYSATDSLHPSPACEAIRKGAAMAVSRAATLKPVPIPDRLVLDVEMQVPTATELAALVPGAERISQLVVRRELADPAEVIGLSMVWYELAGRSMAARMAVLGRR
jgi:D-amino peptidase